MSTSYLVFWGVTIFQGVRSWIIFVGCNDLVTEKRELKEFFGFWAT